MIRSFWRTSAALAVVCLIPLSACESRAGAAAFVGDTRIGDSRVQDLTDAGLGDPAVRAGVKSVSEYRGVVLSRLIKHELIARVAAKVGVTATDGEVAQVLSAEQQRAGGAQKLEAAIAAAPLGLPKGQIEPFFRDLILLDKIGAQLTKGQVLTEAELRAFYDQNGGAAVGPYEQIRPQVLQALRRQRAARETEKYVKDFLGQVRVKVNPRYGSFDAAKFFDAQQAPVLKPSPDDFFRAQSSGTEPQPAEAPSP